MTPLLSPASDERADLRDAVRSLGRIGSRGRLGAASLAATLRGIHGPSLRLLAYAAGLKVPLGQPHTRLVERCVPAFRQHYKRTTPASAGHFLRV